MRPKYTQGEAEAAYDEWGANCGPNALAFVTGRHIDEIRPVMEEVGFPQKKYTNPTMMAHALRILGVEHARELPLDRWPDLGLIRVQWKGPWTDSGANPCWAYRHTHWIAGYINGVQHWVFDVNGGCRPLPSWRMDVAPKLANYKRSYGTWSWTHVWKVSDL